MSSAVQDLNENDCASYIHCPYSFATSGLAVKCSGVEENKADHSDEKLEDELTVAEVSLPDSTSFGFQERELPPTASFTKIYSNSELFAVELEIPVGAVLEEKEEDGFVVVEEVSEGAAPTM
ncbi:hypothetical protein CYMTET_15957 [Cymbomonas tetramitiformis]|uniref:Uncharacterized protein n=1 Tax=Cymbomonas tetramitiformis TaxID=36881 RepID=A0AAE0L8U1_9CHLO|nr:hypothetical protein CYMTET_15957 [Cymbomonas tetramitiformis]